MSLLSAIGGGRVWIPEQGAPRPPRRGQPVRPLRVAAVLLAAGLLLAAAVTQTRRAAPAVDRQRAALQAQIAARTREVDGLTAARARLQGQLAAAHATAARSGSTQRAAAATNRRLAPITGAQAVRGPGLTVRLDNPPSAKRVARTITDSDVQQVANQLWSAGAEAVAVNGVRLTSRTAIRDAGGALLVDFQPQSPPYLVAAVGAPGRLSAGFAASPLAARLRSAVTVFSIGLSVRTADALLLPASRSLATPAPGSPP